MTEPIELARLRQGLYRYFGEALLPPKPARLESIDAAGRFLDGAGVDRFAFFGPWRRFADAAGAVDVALLAGEYVRLFASGVDGALCPPTESYYRGQAEGGGIARVISDVEQAYHRMGVAPPAGSETPDHAAVELEAMSMLCRREGEERRAQSPAAVMATLQYEEWFLRVHLASWFPKLRRRVEVTGDAIEFYQALVDAVDAYLIHDVDLVTLFKRDIEGTAA